jgi:hypothetical protein
MSKVESIGSFVESEEPTTVLDAYDAVMSLGETSVLALATQIWNDLPPETQLEIQRTAYTTYAGNMTQAEQYKRQLMIFAYVNRAPGEPLEYPSAQEGT